MRVLFDGLILEEVYLQKVSVTVSAEDPSKFDVVSSYGDELTVLATFDTQAEAKTYVNNIGEKLKAEGSSIVDVRN